MMTRNIERNLADSEREENLAIGGFPARMYQIML